eukprot:3606-Pyramimonas_sp.AAC.1
MATCLLWTIQRADARASARLRFVRCGSKWIRRGPMLTWESHRSRLREHFSPQANVATFLLWTIPVSYTHLRAHETGAYL